MLDDRPVQPRQIYASTLTRRERRWARRRARGLRATALVLACAIAALTLLARGAPVLLEGPARRRRECERRSRAPASGAGRGARTLHPLSGPLGRRQPPI